MVKWLYIKIYQIPTSRSKDNAFYVMSRRTETIRPACNICQSMFICALAVAFGGYITGYTV